MSIATAIAIMMMVCVAIPATAQGFIAVKALDSIARQPEAAGEIRGALMMSLALVEALTIYGLVIGFVLAGKI